MTDRCRCEALSAFAVSIAVVFFSGCRAVPFSAESADDRWRKEFNDAYGAAEKSQAGPAERHYLAALAILNQARINDERKARTCYELAELLDKQRRYDDALPYIETAVALFDARFQPAGGGESNNVAGLSLARALNLAGHIAWMRKNTGQAESYFKRALIVEKAIVAPLELRHSIVTSYSTMMKQAGRKKEANLIAGEAKDAESSLTMEEARAVKEASWIKLDRDAESAARGANYSNAERLYKKAIERAREKEPEKEKLAKSLLGLAGVYDAQGKYSKALPLGIEALELAERTLPPRSTRIVAYQSRLASIYCHSGDFENAEALYETSLSVLYGSSKERYSHETRHTMSCLASMFVKNGKTDKAERLLREKIDVETKAYGKRSRKVMLTLIELGEAFEAAGRFADAEKTFDRAIRMNAEKLDPRHLIEARNKRAASLRKLGRAREADEEEAQAVALRKELFDVFTEK